MQATTLTLTARPRTDSFHVSEATAADTMHPLTSFAARGRLYYLDADHFPDKQLLAALVPDAVAATAATPAAATEAAVGQQPQQQQPPPAGVEQQQQQRKEH